MAFDFINYYKLDWIESTGTQYIDTGWSKGSGDDGPIIHMDFEFTDTSSSLQGLFGCNHGSTYQYRQYIGANTNNTWYLRWRNSEYTSSATWALNTRYDLEAKLRRDNKYIKINGTNVISNTSYESNYPSLVMYLFALNNNGTAQNFSNIRLYSASLYSETTLVRDFVPAQRKSDDVVGLYDILNEVFYTNAGTGSFIASPTHDVDETIYTKLEYIEATGTQYINTGITAAQQVNLIVEADIAWTATSGDMGFIASKQTSGDTRRYFAYGYNGNWQSGFNTLASSGIPLVANEKKHVETKISDGDSYMKFDGVTVATSTASYSTTGTKTLTIFALNSNSSVQCYAKGRLYSFKAYDCSNNNALLKEFVPVSRIADGVIGLYEKVSDTFYTNAGTGSFIGGFDNPYRRLSYIQSSGTQYINLNRAPNTIGRLVIDFVPMLSGSRQIPIGSWNSSYTTYILQHNTSNAIDITVTGVTKSNVSGKTLTIGTRYVYDYNPNGNEITLNGNKYCNTSGYASSTRVLYLFASNDSSDGAYCKSSTKVYSLKIYDKSGNLTEDYIPVQRISDGVIGIYDQVNDVFRTNAGSGTFSYKYLYDVIIQEQPQDGGITTGEGSYEDASAAILEATANTNYIFDHWDRDEIFHKINGNNVITTPKFSTTTWSNNGWGSWVSAYGAGVANNYVTFEFSEPTVITQYAGQNVTDGSAIAWSFTFLGSHDGVNYTEIQTDAFPATGNKTVMVSNTTAYKYYRLRYSAYNNSWDTKRYIFQNLSMVGYKKDTSTENPWTIYVENTTNVVANFKRLSNCRFKVNNDWKYATMYKKVNGEWVTGNIKIKVNGSWVEGY